MTIYTLKTQSKHKDEKKDFLTKIAEVFSKIENYATKHSLITSIIILFLLGNLLYIGMAIDASRSLAD